MPVVWDDPDTFSMSTTVTLGYRVRFVDDLLDSSPDHRDLWGAQRHRSKRRLVFIERNLDRIYGRRFRAMFERYGLDCQFVRVPSGERTKRKYWLWRSVDRLNTFDPLRLDEPVIIIATGVVADREGFAAGLIRRGVPTYLVCADEMTIGDAGPAFKVAIDYRRRKNRIGLFTLNHQEIYICRPLQRTEPKRVAISGGVESIKYALVADAELFSCWERHGAVVIDEAFQGLTKRGDEAADMINRRTAEGMSRQHEANPLERKLNKGMYVQKETYIGHGISTVLEMAVMPLWWRRLFFPTRLRRYDLLHGEAVALDILITAAIARLRGILSAGDFERIVNLFDRIRVPLWHPLLANWRLIERGLLDATQHRNGNLNLPLPDGIGQCTFAMDVNIREEVRTAIAHVYETASVRHNLQSPYQRQRRPHRLGPVTSRPAWSGPGLLFRRLVDANPIGS
jgi:3-dehydroquinate synthetase